MDRRPHPGETDVRASDTSMHDTCWFVTHASPRGEESLPYLRDRASASVTLLTFTVFSQIGDVERVSQRAHPLGHVIKGALDHLQVARELHHRTRVIRPPLE